MNKRELMERLKQIASLQEKASAVDVVDSWSHIKKQTADKRVEDAIITLADELVAA